jgi:ABC transporter substrate binding protein
MYYAADNTAIIDPIDAPNIRRQVGFNPLPLLITQPKQILAHDPDPPFKPNQDRIVDAQKLMSSDPSQIPIVFIATNDPVGLGIVKSLSHPGGNLTGFLLYEVSLAGKLVEFFKEMAPGLARVGLLFNPNNSSAEPYWRLIEDVAKSIGVVAVSFPVHDAGSIQNAIGVFAQQPNGVSGKRAIRVKASVGPTPRIEVSNS